MEKNIQRLLEKAKLNSEDLLQIVKSDEINDINIVEKNVENLYKKQSQGKDVSKEIQNYLKQGLIGSTNLEVELTQIKQLKKELKEVEKTIKQNKYINKTNKKILMDITKNVSNKNEYKLLQSFLGQNTIDDKSIIKILSGFQNAVDDTSKIGMINKGEWSDKIKSIISDYKKEGMSKKVMSNLKTLSNEMSTAKTDKGEQIFDIKEEDKLNDLISKSLKKDINENVYESVFKDVIKFAKENNLQDTEAYNKLLMNEISFGEFIGIVKKQTEINQKLLEEQDNEDKILETQHNRQLLESLDKLNNNIEAQTTDENSILSNTLINTLKEENNLSEQQVTYIKDLVKKFTNNEIKQDILITELKLLHNGNSNIENILETQVDLTEDMIKNNEVTNKDKILEQKRLEVNQQTIEELEKIADNIKANDNQGILSDITKSSDIENATETAVSKMLEKGFGEGTFLEYLGDKMAKKMKLDKVGHALTKSGKNLFSRALGKGGGLIRGLGSMGSTALRGATALAPTALEAGGAALSGLGGAASSAGAFLVSNPIGWAIAGTLAAGAVGYGAYRLKYGKDKDLVDKLKKQGVVDYSFFGDSKIKDWGSIYRLKDDDIKKLVHFNDWDKNTTNKLKDMSKIPEKLRIFIGEEIQNGKITLDKNNNLHFTDNAINDLINSGLNPKNMDNLSKLLDKQSKKKLGSLNKDQLSEKSLKEKDNKDNKLQNNKTDKQQNNKPKPKSDTDLLDEYYNAGITDLANLTTSTRLPIKTVRQYLANKNIHQDKITVDTNTYNKTKEKNKKEEDKQNIIVTNNYATQSTSNERFIDKSNMFYATRVGL